MINDDKLPLYNSTKNLTDKNNIQEYFISKEHQHFLINLAKKFQESICSEQLIKYAKSQESICLGPFIRNLSEIDTKSKMSHNKRKLIEKACKENWVIPKYLLNQPIDINAKLDDTLSSIFITMATEIENLILNNNPKRKAIITDIFSLYRAESYESLITLCFREIDGIMKEIIKKNLFYKTNDALVDIGEIEMLACFLLVFSENPNETYEEVQKNRMEYWRKFRNAYMHGNIHEEFYEKGQLPAIKCILFLCAVNDLKTYINSTKAI